MNWTTNQTKSIIHYSEMTEVYDAILDELVEEFAKDPEHGLRTIEVPGNGDVADVAPASNTAGLALNVEVGPACFIITPTPPIGRFTIRECINPRTALPVISRSVGRIVVTKSESDGSWQVEREALERKGVFIERYEAFDDWLALVISKARYYVPKPKRAGE